MSVLEVRPLELDGVVEIRPQRFGDERGFFSEVWNEDAAGARPASTCDFVQDNHSLFGRAGVLRGLHFQLAPAAQDKLVRVSRRRDIRRRGRYSAGVADLRPLGRRSHCRPRNGTSCSCPRASRTVSSHSRTETEVLYKVQRAICARA